MFKLSLLLKKKISGILIISFIGGMFVFTPPKAEAVGAGIAGCIQGILSGAGLTTLGAKTTAAITGVVSTAVPVYDSNNFEKNSITAQRTSDIQNKEFNLDKCIKGLISELIHQLTTSLIQWINNGFQGSPTFIEDPTQFFGNMADQTIGLFIDGSGLDFLCTPFKLQIQMAMRRRYSQEFRARCTPSKIAEVHGFTNKNFGESGGWTGWIELTTKDENNIYGSWVRANSDLNSAVSYRLNNTLTQLGWGNGFFSIPDPETGKISTPGTIIAGQTNKIVGSNIDQLQLAKEFDDIIYALINQLTQQLLTQGLRNSDGGGSGRRVPRKLEEDINRLNTQSREDISTYDGLPPPTPSPTPSPTGATTTSPLI